MLAAKAAALSKNMKELLSEEELLNCVGLEAMFTRNPINRLRVITEVKRRHLVAVQRAKEPPIPWTKRNLPVGQEQVLRGTINATP
jgi:hypothetical protein